MMLFKDFNRKISILTEKLILPNSGAKMGQVVFMAGGAASGKSFAIDNFMDGKNYKVRDVDSYKMALKKLDELGKLKNLPFETSKPIKDMDMRNPKDVTELHGVVSNLGLKFKPLKLLLKNLKEDRLPNIVFDVTVKDTYDVDQIIPMLLKVGYKPKDIHLIWVLTDYSVAIKSNRERERVVPDNIMLVSHEGVARTMVDIANGGETYTINPKRLWGEIHVILGNRENTIWFTDQDTKQTIKSGKQEKGESLGVVKSFKSMKIKDSGKAIKPDVMTKTDLLQWVRDNIPKTPLTKDIF